MLNNGKINTEQIPVTDILMVRFIRREIQVTAFVKMSGMHHEGHPVSKLCQQNDPGDSAPVEKFNDCCVNFPPKECANAL